MGGGVVDRVGACVVGLSEGGRVLGDGVGEFVDGFDDTDGRVVGNAVGRLHVAASEYWPE